MSDSQPSQQIDTQSQHRQIIVFVPNPKTDPRTGVFSNNSSGQPFDLDGKRWPSSMHYFQAQKFAGTSLEEQIRTKAKTPYDAVRLGRSRDFPLRADWEEVKVDVMRRAIYAKFSQNTDARRLLLETGDAELVERDENDAFWADGGENGTGLNMLGRVLMEVRDKLRSEV